MEKNDKERKKKNKKINEELQKNIFKKIICINIGFNNHKQSLNI